MCQSMCQANAGFLFLLPFLCWLPDGHSVLAGNLAFPKGLSSGPGRPRVPPKSPVVFDVELVYVPGQLIIALAYKLCK